MIAVAFTKIKPGNVLPAYVKLADLEEFPHSKVDYSMIFGRLMVLLLVTTKQ